VRAEVTELKVDKIEKVDRLVVVDMSSWAVQGMRRSVAEDTSCLHNSARAPERGIADRTAAAAAAVGLVVGSDTHKNQAAAVVVVGLAAIDQV